MNHYKKFLITGFAMLLLIPIGNSVWAQKPYRVGTTAANFLEIGFGAAGGAMGDAYVSTANDLSSIYWNPAGLAYMTQNEAQFSYQPWIADINTAFVGAGFVMPRLGTFALGIYSINYGSMPVTTLAMQEGTGETFQANDYAISFSYSRKLAQWFAFGGSAKYVSSQIWNTGASAFAIDLGAIVSTYFFSPTANREDGLRIAMSISNYGTKLKYDGMDLLHPIDILPYEEGNYRDVRGKFELDAWELPLIFRFGTSLTPLVMNQHRLTLALDALHPNNNSESVNLGAEYQFNVPTMGSFFLRGGYKALFVEDSEFGATFGGGFVMRMLNNVAVKLDYAYRGVGILGKTHSYTFGIMF